MRICKLGITRMILWAVIIGLGFSCSNKKGNSESKKAPNIIIFIADDAAWDDSGAYGNPSIKTPTIDQLAREGIVFTSAFLTTSSCSPSRSSIMTGLYPHQTGASELHQPLPLDNIIFPGELKKQGYYTVSAGKWHLGPPRPEFDSIYMAHEPSGAADWVRAVRNRPKDKPFFMWLAAIDPHRGYQAGIIANPHKWSDVVVPPYLPDNDSTQKDLALYYDEISRLDSNMQQVIDELKQQNEFDNTLIIYMSDNGRPFPRDKTRLYDSGIKTPLIMRWPSEIKAGSVSGALVSSIDIAPTLLELAGAEIPDIFQGKSLVSLFSDPEAEINDYIFAEHNWHDYQSRERAVRDKKYLFIQNYFPHLNANPPADAASSITYQHMIRLYEEGLLPETQLDCFKVPRSEEELYNVEKDPFQMNNLINNEAHAEIIEKMRTVLEEWKMDTNDTLPQVITPDKFDRLTGKRLP